MFKLCYILPSPGTPGCAQKSKRLQKQPFEVVEKHGFSNSLSIEPTFSLIRISAAARRFHENKPTHMAQSSLSWPSANSPCAPGFYESARCGAKNFFDKLKRLLPQPFLMQNTPPARARARGAPPRPGSPAAGGRRSGGRSRRRARARRASAA